MKKAMLLIMALLMAIAIFGCANKGQSQENKEEVSQPTPSRTQSQPAIALVLSGEKPFNVQFIAKAQEIAQSMGYKILSYYSDSGSDQVDNIYKAIGEGSKGIIIEPYDMDNLQLVLEECDAQSIPVINALIPINGIVKMLISPDYTQIGKLAAKSADAFGEERANILSIEDKNGNFVNQLIHDGLETGANELENVFLISSLITDDNADAAYSLITNKLDESVNTIFAYTEEIAKGAAKAAKESERQINIIAFGGSGDIMAMIESGDIMTGIFLSPNQLAKLSIENVIASINGIKIPQYSNLSIEKITQADIEKYKYFGTYADLLTQPTQAPVQPSETPSQTKVET